MADESVPAETTETPGLDMDAASDQIGASLFPETAEPETPVEQVTEALADGATQPTDDVKQSATPAATQHASEASASTPVPLPKSFKADLGEMWAKIPPEAQQYYVKREKEMLDGLEQYKGAANYGKTMHEAIAPYQPTLQAQGIEAPQAVRTLLEAHYKLTSGTMESRQAAYRDLGTRLGLPQQASPSATDSTTPQVDPRIQTLEQQLQSIQETLTAQQQTALTAARTKAGEEVSAFATATNKDGSLKNALFDAVHEDILRFIKLGDSLQEAYDKAVWANPVTREQQVQARLQTETEKARERARLDALPKQKARGVNVNGKETPRTPTEPLGDMTDTLKDTYRTIKERTVH